MRKIPIKIIAQTHGDRGCIASSQHEEGDHGNSNLFKKNLDPCLQKRTAECRERCEKD